MQYFIENKMRINNFDPTSGYGYYEAQENEKILSPMNVIVKSKVSC